MWQTSSKKERKKKGDIATKTRVRTVRTKYLWQTSSKKKRKKKAILPLRLEYGQYGRKYLWQTSSKKTGGKMKGLQGWGWCVCVGGGGGAGGMRKACDIEGRDGNGMWTGGGKVRGVGEKLHFCYRGRGW